MILKHCARSRNCTEYNSRRTKIDSSIVCAENETLKVQFSQELKCAEFKLPRNILVLVDQRLVVLSLQSCINAWLHLVDQVNEGYVELMKI